MNVWDASYFSELCQIVNYSVSFYMRTQSDVHNPTALRLVCHRLYESNMSLYGEWRSNRDLDSITSFAQSRSPHNSQGQEIAGDIWEKIRLSHP